VVTELARLYVQGVGAVEMSIGTALEEIRPGPPRKRVESALKRVRPANATHWAKSLGEVDNAQRRAFKKLVVDFGVSARLLVDVASVHLMRSVEPRLKI
jgi:hypothetical protein